MPNNRDTVILVALLCCIYACGTDSVKELPSILNQAEGPNEMDSNTISCIALHYQYTDHKKFLNWIDGADSLRRAYGLKDQTVLRIAEDTTRVLELLNVSTIVRGNEFANSADLKNLADTWGFIGTPTVYLLNAVHMQSKVVGANCILLQHSVSDFSEWRTHFEEYNAGNDNENVRALCIFSTYQDPNAVSVLMEVKDLDMARAMVSSPETIATMRDMGATSDPKMTLLEVLR